jgi:phage shock protein PspC (stress-responsive transcriptional regulator)
LTVILAGLTLIILGYKIAGGLLIAIYLIAALFNPSNETVDDIVDDIAVYYLIMDKRDDSK